MLLLAVWTVEALLQLASPSDPQMRPDGTAYAYVMRGGIHMAALNANSHATQIAKGTRPRWSPDSKRLAFLDRQVKVYTPASRVARTVTHSPTPVTSYSWSPEGEAVYYLSPDSGTEPDPVVADRDYRYSRLYRQPVSGGPPKLITRSDRHVISFAVSPDLTRAVYAAQPTPLNRDAFNADLYEIDLRSGKEKILVYQPGRDADPSYSPDGRWIVFHSQAGSLDYFGARHLAVITATGGPVRYITAQHGGLDVFRNGTPVTWSPNSRALTYTAGRGVQDVLVQHDLESDQIQVLTEGIAGAASFSNDRSRSVLLQTSVEKPPEVYLRQASSLVPLTRHQEGVKAFPRIRSEQVQWKASDGLPVEGVLWLPIGYHPGKPVPLITDLHGGPTGVTLHAFPTPRVYPIQALLQHGFAVFSPNFRGSSNYGAAFRQKNALSQGIGDYDDVMTGVDALIAKGIADPDRLGIMGWSYGGYLAGSTISQTNRFKAASIGAPATDWLTYYGQSDASPDVLSTYFGGSPWEVPQNYNRHSSRSKLKDIRTPALLQVGSVDINHNGEIYKALYDHKVPVEYVVYPREGHGISEPAHVRDVMERNLRWFVKWLKPETAQP